MFCNVQIMASMFYITVSTFLAATLNAVYSTFLFAGPCYATQASLLHYSLVNTLFTGIYSSLTSIQSVLLRPLCPCSLSNTIFSVIKSLLYSLAPCCLLSHQRGQSGVSTSSSCLEFISPIASTIPGPGGLWSPASVAVWSSTLFYDVTIFPALEEY